MKILYIIILIVLTSINSNAKYEIGLIPDLLRKNADVVIRKSNIDISLKKNFKGVITITKAITIFKKSDYQDLIISYDKDSKIKKFKAILYDSHGTIIRKIGRKELKDYASDDGISLITDNRLKYAYFAYNKYPYTIEYTYQKSVNNQGVVFLPQMYIQSHYKESVQNSSYTIQFPKNITLMYNSRNCDYKPTKTENKWNWEINNIPALIKEPFAPLVSSIFPRVEIKVKDYIYDDYRGSWENWETFGQFLFKLHKNRQYIPLELSNKIKNITADCNSDSEKISVIYKYLQNNYRYVSIQLGIGGWQPFSANNVCKNKYGDCKALSNFMHSMLKEVDILSYPAVIFSSRTQKIDLDSSYAYSYFNHEILYLPNEKKWLECTSPFSPPNYINYSNANRKALLITPEGGKLIDTPIFDENINIRSSFSSISLTNEKFVVDNIQYLEGEKQEYLRAVSNYDDSYKEKHVLKLLSNSLVDLDNYNININHEEPKVTLKTNFSILKPINTNSLILDVFPFYDKYKVPKLLKNRKYNLSVRHAYTETDTINYILTVDYNISKLPEDISIKSIYGSYSLTFNALEPNTIQIIRTKIIKHTEALPEHYELFRQYLKTISKYDRKKLYIEKE